ncbi:MAG: hypothetical protein H8E12_05770 [Rhodobacteraceae bacterium]|nr:hypothetical protein [Paracoccaceae bacterium]
MSKIKIRKKLGHIKYPGSTTQQNFGESIQKGWLLWEIESKDNFSSEFIELKNDSPFITLDWSEIDTSNDSSHIIPFGARIRLKHPQDIPRAEVKQFKSLLREKFGASEIVTRVETPPTKERMKISDEQVVNFRDYGVLLALFKEFHSDKQYDEEMWELIALRLKRYCEMIPKADTARGTKWSIEKMAFDNMFGYGEGNVIDFTELNGVVGLFGRNRVGKSSIPGTISYGLFNTSDRGSLKNLHIINTRKNYCKTEIDIAIDGKKYKIQRQSVKKASKKNSVSASTHLNIFELNSQGEIVKDITGEQRRDTDDTLSKLIGDKDDFFLTTLASQGQMNAFIQQRATSRKAVLANFLDLAVFDTLYELIHKDASYIKSKLTKIPERNWGSIISDTELGIIENKNQMQLLESETSSLQSRLNGLRLELSDINPKNIITRHEVTRKEEKLKEVSNRLINVDTKILDTRELIIEYDRKIKKTELFELSFPLLELEQKLQEQCDLERNLLTIKHKLESENNTLKRQRESAKILKDVPCGDVYPTCKFIKKSHKDAKMLDKQIDDVNDIKKTTKDIQHAFDKLIDQKLSDKINSYRKIVKSASTVRLSKATSEFDLASFQKEKSELEESEILISDQLVVMSSQLITESDNPDISILTKKIQDLEDLIRDHDVSRLSLSEKNGTAKAVLEQLKEEKSDYESTLGDWKIYDALLMATNKRGVPLHVLNSRLPKINAEIAKILDDSTNFSVTLDAPTDSNEMNIYIDYGDSCRPIECASGMEKMLSSLAIRVALINISSLPKSDILIIDEGFGTLDDNNVEACGKLLQSLKNYFKTIFIISHIDAVKDSVDDLIEITKKGVDAYVHAV